MSCWHHRSRVARTMAGMSWLRAARSGELLIKSSSLAVSCMHPCYRRSWPLCPLHVPIPPAPSLPRPHVVSTSLLVFSLIEFAIFHTSTPTNHESNNKEASVQVCSRANTRASVCMPVRVCVENQRRLCPDERLCPLAGTWAHRRTHTPEHASGAASGAAGGEPQGCRREAARPPHDRRHGEWNASRDMLRNF